MAPGVLPIYTAFRSMQRGRRSAPSGYIEPAFEVTPEAPDFGRLLSYEQRRAARSVRKELNQLAKTPEAVALMKSLTEEGSNMVVWGPVRYESFSGTIMQMHLVLTKNGFRIGAQAIDYIRHTRLSEEDYWPGEIKWKWTSHMIELMKGGLSIDPVKSWITEKTSPAASAGNNKQPLKDALPTPELIFFRGGGKG